MTIKDCTRVFPVYTWHSVQLLKASKMMLPLVELITNGNRDSETQDYICNLFLQVDDLAKELARAKDDIIYVEKSDLDLIKKAVEWIS